MFPSHVTGKQIGMRVLLVEDDSATAQSIELMLKSESFNVYATDLGEEGIDLGKIYDYDIILLDLNLPDMSGFDVLRKLRVSKVKSPVLILSTCPRMVQIMSSKRTPQRKSWARSACPRLGVESLPGVQT